MRVLITGGYGCIGAWIIRNLLARGDEVWVYDLKEDPRRLRLILPEERGREGRVRPGRRDRPAGALAGAIAEHGITHVIHLAGLQVPTCRADPLLGAKVNVLGTLAVFEAVKAAGDAGASGSSTPVRAAVFGGPDKYPAGPLGRRRAARAEHALRRLQVLQRGERPHLLPGLRPLAASACGRGRSTASAATSA